MRKSIDNDPFRMSTNYKRILIEMYGKLDDKVIADGKLQAAIGDFIASSDANMLLMNIFKLYIEARTDSVEKREMNFKLVELALSLVEKK